MQAALIYVAGKTRTTTKTVDWKMSQRKENVLLSVTVCPNKSDDRILKSKNIIKSVSLKNDW